ncbi:MAG: xanthine/uracil/vitamin C permease [Anaerolineae bacterium]
MTTVQSQLAARVAIQFSKGDWDGFLMLTTGNLATIMILPVILISTFAFAPEIVFGKILPGLGLNLLVGLGLLTYLALKLAKVENRADVTALPFGVSAPVMFVYLFSIIGPVYFTTKDPLLAYRLALGAAFSGGLIQMSGAFIGPWLARITPQAGMMGTIAGVAIVWMAFVPSAIIFTNPMIGLVSLFMLLLGLVGRYQFPFRLPAGLVVISLGVILGLLMGQATFTVDELSFYWPVPVLEDLWVGLRLLMAHPELLAIVIPIQIFNFIETMGNVESAKTSGDTYGMRTCQLGVGFAICLGAIFGSPFPTTVYLGHPAYRQMGAGSGFAVVAGLFLFLASLVGLFGFLQHLIPAACVAALLVFVGLVMTNYAFRATPPAHGVAIAIALIPHMGDLLKKQLDGTLLEVLHQDVVTPEFASKLAENQGVYFQSYGMLSHGAIITGLLWGAIVAFLIDGDLRKAMLFSFFAFALSLVGLIHAEQIGLSLSPITIGYLGVTILFGLFHLAQLKRSAFHQ